ncbi:MAG TPA: NAD-glutamate dehydrogenase domain-containing protein, partial [Miltoncostaeaceae bacterium]|nr:NAD-glutamate dehydrogenase domain-containing protein [Miltoncostaeaceae bacterium]
MPDPAGSRDHLLSQAAAQAVAELPEDAGAVSAERLLARYYRHAPADDLADRPPEALAGAAFSHLRLAARRAPGRATVRVHTPTRDADGWDAHGTAVEVVTDDMPFIVDSVTACLTGAGHAIRLLVHPVMAVRRDGEGRLLELLDGEPGEQPAGALAESWLRVEIEPQPDGEATKRIARQLTGVLEDVRRAVDDWGAMRAAALRAADTLERDLPKSAAKEAGEARDLLRWLAVDRFTFLGSREYTVSDGAMVPVPGSGLGILRPEPAGGALEWSAEEGRARAGIARPLVVTRSEAVSTVRERARLDDLAVTRFGPDGAPAGALRIVGLMTAAAAAEPVARVPLLRRRAAEVVKRCGFAARGHDARELAELLEAYPRDELFQASGDEAYAALMPVVGLAERRQLRAHLRRDELGRFWSAVIWFPRDRFTTFARRRMERILREATGAVSVDHASRVTDAPLARVHLVAWTAPGTAPADLDVPALQRRLAAATRSWADDLADALVDALGGEAAALALARWGDAFPEAYKEDFPARSAVGDIAALAALGGEGEIGTNLYDPAGALPGERRLKVYRLGPAIPLSQILPLLERMRLEVIDERPYELFPAEGPPAWIYDFGLRFEGTPAMSGPAAKARFEEAFAAVWRGIADADGFAALVPYAGLDWRRAMVLGAYARHMRQSGSAYGHGYVRDCLVANPTVAVSLIRLFEARLDPDEADPAREEAFAAGIERALRDVPSLDHDRILRSLAARIRATVRTDFFRDRPAGEAAGTLVLKIDPRAIPDVPEPRPAVETWVFSPRVEGVHLRFGPIARGGIRWSERPEDLRTEVLGLVKAQSVKNAVIVPVGGKGG